MKKEETGEEEVEDKPIKVKPKPVQVERVVTEYQEAFNVEGETLSMNQYLAWIGNKLIRIEKGVVE